MRILKLRYWVLYMLGCTLMLLNTACAEMPVRSASVTVQNWPVIVVDAGHGGMDGGAVGPDGLLEKDLNLSISTKLVTILQMFGLEVVQTRTEDVMQGSKGDDTRARAELTASLGEDVLFVSIHQNKFPQTSSHGTQVFYGLLNTQSEPLAELLQTKIVTMLQPENHRLCQPGNDSIYLLTHLKCPAVLIECGFLSNDSDAALLTDEEYQEKLAFTIAGTLLEYLSGSGENMSIGEVSPVN